jgi:hypothetical protein
VKLAILINGYTGVGKSAVFQTFTAEYLVDNELHGASGILCLTKHTHDLDRIFLTIAYQLARRTEGYRVFFNGKLTQSRIAQGLGPYFRTFIAEPFCRDVSSRDTTHNVDSSALLRRDKRKSTARDSSVGTEKKHGIIP